MSDPNLSAFHLSRDIIEKIAFITIFELSIHVIDRTKPSFWYEQHTNGIIIMIIIMMMM
jgi:hypothetical protein